MVYLLDGRDVYTVRQRLNAFAARAATTLGKLTSRLQLSDQRLSSLNLQRPLRSPSETNLLCEAFDD
jgi:hypothetical protein